MSTTIDNRIVEMRFDNKHFESNVASTMSTLDKLKQKLNLSGASKGLDELGRSASKVDMSGVGKGIDTLTAKFSSLQVIGVTALANITNSAVNAGKRMVSALTIDPIKTGFNEYETKMNSIQTIMSNTASKGTTMADVTKVIDELNTYADKTIYNFAEMTRNIGTFTAAGVGLNESAAAIQGIANLAAASGSNSQQASTAMYQLSQALAAGTVKLMDWNSVVNAGMGGEKFQLALQQTAREMGIGVDSMIEKNGSFRESLQEGWLSADVLNTTLQKFTKEGAQEYADAMVKSGKYTREQADALMKEAQMMEDAATEVKTFTQLWDTMKESAQSGWGKTWELIIGDFENAKGRLSELSKLFGNVIEASSDRRNNLLEGALSSNWDILTRKLNAAGIETETFQNKIKELAKNHNVDLDAMIEKEGSFSAALQKAFSGGQLDKGILKDVIKSFVGDMTGATKSTEGMTKSMEQYGEIVDKVIRGDLGAGEERIKKLTEAGYDYATVQNLVNEKLGSSVRHMASLSNEQLKNADNLAALSDEQLENKGYTEEQITALRDLAKVANESDSSISKLIDTIDRPSGAELIWGSFLRILNSVIDAGAAVGDAWREIFPPMTTDQLYGIISAVHKFTEHLVLTEEGADNLKRTFKGVFALLNIVTTIVGGGVNFAFKALSKILGAFDTDILSVTANIGDALVKFRDWAFESNFVAKAINGLIDKIPGAIVLVKEWVASFMALPEVQAVIEGFKSAFESMADVGRDIIEGLKNGLREGISSVPDILLEIGKNILSTIKGVLGIQSPSTEMFEVGENVIEGLLNGLQNGATTIWNFIKNMASKIAETFNGIDWSKVFAGGISIALLLLVKKLVGILDAITSPLEGLGDVFEGAGKVLDKAAKGIGKVLKSFSKVLNAFAWNLKAQAIRNIVVSLAILVGAIVVLTLIDVDKLWDAVGIVAALAGILAGLFVVMEGMSLLSAKFGGGAIQFGALSVALLGVAGSILLLGITAKLVGSLNPEQATQAFYGMAGLVVAIGVVLAAYGLLVKGKSAQNIDKVGGMLLKLSISLLIIVGVVKLISMMEWNEIGKGAAGMAGFAVFVAALVGISRFSGKGVDKIGGMLLKMSIAMGLMVGVVKLISMMEWNELGKGAAGMAGFTVFILALVGISRLAGKEVPKIGAMLLAMSTSMLLLAGVVKILSGMTWGEIGKAAVGIAGLTAVMRALVLMVNKVGKDVPKIAGTLIAMSLAIGILAGVAVVLSLISLTGLAKGIAAVGLLGIVMSSMIKATKGANDVKGSLIGMSVAIAVMVAAVAVLSMVDGTKLAGATVALSVMMGMFALVAKSAGGMGNVMGSLVVMSLAVGMLGGMIYLLAQLQIESVFEVVLSLSTLLIAISASMLVISKAGAIAPTTLIAVAAMTAVVGGLAAIIGLLAKCNVGSTLEIATSLSVLLLALSASVAVLSLVGPAATGALVGVGVMATLIVAVGALMVGLGALVEFFPGMEEMLNKGIPILEKIGYGLGSFFGNIIGGFSAGVTSGLPVIGENLSAFMGNLQPFIEGARGIDETALSGITSLAKMMALLAGANILEAVSSWLTGKSSMETFSAGLGPFADAIVAFSNKVKGNIDETSVTAAANAGLMMSKMQSMISGTGGVVQWFTGEKNLADFGVQLVIFGSAIVNFSKTVAGKVDTAAVEAAASAGLIMTELQSKVQPSGGVVQWFMGEKNFATFGTQLVAFGNAITQFSKTVSTEGAINEGAITAAANAGTIMSTMQSKLVGTGGVVQWFTGEKNMVSFGVQLVAFGQALTQFSKTVSAEGAINDDAIKAAANAGTLMATLQSKVVPTGGVFELFSGTKNLTNFGAQIVMFGEAIVSFSETVKGNINEDSVTAAAAAGKVMASLQKSIPENKWLDGKASLDDFGRDIKNFGIYMADYAKRVSGIDTGTLNGSLSAAKGLVALTKSIAGIDTSDIKEFTAVKTIGVAMKSYAGQVEGIDASVVSSSVSSARNLTSLVSNLAGLDTSGISNFKVDSIGRSIKSYADSVSGMNIAAVSVSISSIHRLIGLIRNMAGLNTSGVSSFTSALNNLGKVSLSGITKSFSGASARLSTIGSSMMDGLTSGMRSKQSAINSAATLMVTTMHKNIANKTDMFKKAGTSLITSLIAGITSQRTNLSTTFASSLQLAVTSIRNQYNSFSTAGSYLAEGFANGIALKAHLSEMKARSMAKAAAQAIEDELLIESPSKVTEQDGEFFGEGLAGGITNSTPVVEEAAKGLGEASNDILASTITDGAAKVQTAQDKVGEALVNSTEETQDKLAEVKQRDIAAENAYWGNLLASRKKGTDAAKYETMKMAEFEKEVLDETISVWDNYINEIDSKSDSLMGQRNLFEAVPEPEPVIKEGLIDNLESQVDEYQKFSDTVTSLNEKIQSESLKEYINTLGVDSIYELQAINSMTDAELTNYASLYEQKYALARTTALTQLDTLKSDTEAKLSNLFGGVNVDASSFATSFTGSMDSIKEYVATALNQTDLGKTVGSNLAEGVAQGITDAATTTSTAATGMIDTALDAAKKAADIHSPSGLFEREVGTRLIEGMTAGMSQMVSEIEKVINDIIDNSISRFTESYDRFVDTGSMLTEGFKQGILSKAGEVSDAAAEIARAAMDAVSEELDVHSPSRALYKIGGFTGLGFVNGLKAYRDICYKTGSEVGTSAKKGLSNAISKINDIINGDVDMQPTIRPVLDLSSVESGVGAINGLFNNNRLGVSANIDAINAMTRDNQNGGLHDVVSAIDKLRKDLGGIESNTYTVNGVTYDDGSNISEAVKSLVRAARVERRV